jgi:hypothetical protein
MDCSLSVLIACFSWSNLYLDSGLIYQDAGVYQTFTEHSYALVEGTEMRADKTWSTRESRNPYGRLTLGYEIEFRSVSWRLDLSHVSSLETGQDRGVNSLSFSARWHPFR